MFDYYQEDDLHPPYSPVSESNSDGLNFPCFSMMMDYLSSMCKKESTIIVNELRMKKKQKSNRNDERGFNLENPADQ
ncbi:unnamed protein product [Bubo scandiacus]